MENHRYRLLGKGIKSSTGVSRATWSTWIGFLPPLQGIALGEIGVYTVTGAEMMYGVGKSQYQEKNKTALQAFLATLEIVDFLTMSVPTFIGTLLISRPRVL